MLAAGQCRGLWGAQPPYLADKRPEGALSAGKWKFCVVSLGLPSSLCEDFSLSFRQFYLVSLISCPLLRANGNGKNRNQNAKQEGKSLINRPPELIYGKVLLWTAGTHWLFRHRTAFLPNLCILFLLFVSLVIAVKDRKTVIFVLQ